MFMVASSVVTTIMILNYHHRKAHTHKNMPDWVRSVSLLQYLILVHLRSEWSSCSGCPGCWGCPGQGRSSLSRPFRCRTRWRRLTHPRSLFLPTSLTWMMTLKHLRLFHPHISHLNWATISAWTINFITRMEQLVMVCLGKNSFLSFIIYCIKQFHNISKLFQPLLLAYICNAMLIK